MNILIAGGTGLLGSCAAEVMINHGHQVHALTLPVSKDLKLPNQMFLHMCNFITASQDELDGYMKGMDAFIFAAGVDERVEFKPPVSEAYMYYNITPLQRLLTSAKKMGVKQAVVLGSYFSYFAKTWPHLKLVENHPYIASRIKQENIAFSYADDSFSVIVLELPYIFGIQEGRKPVWSIFVERFAKPHVIFFPKGGTAMVTTHQVGVAIYHALLYGINGKSYPLVSVNMPWKTMIRHALKAMDMNKSVITIPNWLAALGIKSMQKNYTKKGIEPGLNPKTFSKLMTAYTYIDPNLCADLRLPDDDIVKAIHASMSYAYQIMNQKAEVVDMKDAL